MPQCIPGIRTRFQTVRLNAEHRSSRDDYLMKTNARNVSRVPISLLLVMILAVAAPGAERPPVSAPPESFFKLVRDSDRAAARAFYGKYLDVNGMPVVAHGEVADLALQRTHEIVTHMLAGRPDIQSAMVSNGMYLIIIGKNQLYTDMPEYRNSRNPEYLNERVRGTGGKPTSFGEENLLNLLLDRYDDESIGVHEFCHTIDGALRAIDPTWNRRKNEAFQNARDKGLWKNAYAGSNAGEYWAEIAQSYFDCNRVNNWNHAHIGTRAQLKEYDSMGYELVHTTFNLTAETDWVYRPLQKQPSVIAPPARFKIDPYYTKFTWAREFPVVGRSASDAAMLNANDTIRKMFAYRHDILKALINDGVKLAVLGKGESLGDLPECRVLCDQQKLEARARRLDYRPDCKLLVVPEDELLPPATKSLSVDSPVVRAFAKAAYQVTGTRPVDPDWENRSRDVQQYELRVKRLDIQFDEKLKQLYESAMSKALWKGTPAATDRVEYWAQGVAAYFDAAGNRATNSANTREELKNYDSDLYALVHETMAYEGRQDWRFPMQASGEAGTPRR
jgi:alpha-glucosidase